jgi:predicted PurR-regulated permease PerM
MSTDGPPQRVSLGRLSWLALQLGVIGLVGYGALLAWGELQFILLPFFVAVLLSALLTPVASWLHRVLRLPGWIAAIITVLATIALIAGLLTLVTPDVFRQSEDIVKQVERGVKQIPSLLHDAGLKNSDVQRFTQSLTKKLQGSLGTIGGHLSTGVISAAQGVASAAASVFLALMMLIYLLIDGPGFWRGVLRFAPADRRVAWNDAGHRAWTAVTHYVRSQVIVALIDGVGVATGLTILGIPLALPLGVLTFVLAFLPYVGAVIAGLAAMLVALSTNGVEGMLGALAVTIVVQQIESHILYPLLIGRSVRLHPLTVLLGVGAGSAMLGITGAFLSTPIIAAVAAGAGWLEDDEELGTPVPEDVAPPSEDPLGRASDGEDEAEAEPGDDGD